MQFKGGFPAQHCIELGLRECEMLVSPARYARVFVEG